MSIEFCPQVDELRQAAGGYLSRERSEVIAEHVISCDRCGTACEAFMPDALIEAVRRQPAIVAEWSQQGINADALVGQIRGRVWRSLEPTWGGSLPWENTPPNGGTAEPAGERYDFLAPPQADDELGRLGSYRVLRAIGSGGMGVVFEAEDLQLKRRVALKCMKPALAASTSARKRFVREAQIAASVEHDHIVPIYQVGEDRGIPFIAMPLLRGETLAERLKRRQASGVRRRDGEDGLPSPSNSDGDGALETLPLRSGEGTGRPHPDRKGRDNPESNPGASIENSKSLDGLGRPSSGNGLPLDEVLRIGSEVAEGLAAAHERGLIHRDIKPGNIWLEAGSGRAKILDFGLARAANVDEELTQSGMMLGTPSHMAPEQARGEAVDARADLFSLGCVLYQMSTGVRPFVGRDSLSTVLAVTTQHPLRPREINAALPAELDDLIVSLLSKDPAGRPQSAREVLDALKTIPVAPPPWNVSAADAAPLEDGLPSPSSIESERLRIASSGDGLGRTSAGKRTSPAMVGSAPLAKPQRRRGLVVAGGALFAFLLLAAVMVVVRDKEGKIVAWLKADSGSTVELTADAPARNSPLAETVTAHEAAPAAPKSPAVTSPLSLVEPPPLEEWLKGRTELTVSQDGRGQFKTIQAALDTLRPGQVVRVLDRGPYRERLKAKLPPDCGLVSDCDTVVQVTEDAPATLDQPYIQYHSLQPMNAFRLNGFLFRLDNVVRAHNLHFNYRPGLVIENCVFENPTTAQVGSTALMIWCEPAEAAEGACFIRDCVLSEGSLFLASPGRDGKYPFTVVVERNWFRRDVGFMMGTAQGSFIIRRNFLEGLPSPGPQQNWGNINPVCANGGAGRFEISNNTIADFGRPWSLSGPRSAMLELPTNAVVCNNILPAPIRFDSAAYRWLPQARATWQLGHNLYLKWSSESDELMNAEDDVSDPSPFLSSDPSDANYLRVAAGGIAAKSGAGGQWPAFIGALPPGPAPKDGDWFTRLLQRWRNVHAE